MPYEQKWNKVISGLCLKKMHGYQYEYSLIIRFDCNCTLQYYNNFYFEPTKRKLIQHVIFFTFFFFNFMPYWYDINYRYEIND